MIDLPKLCEIRFKRFYMCTRVMVLSHLGVLAGVCPTYEEFGSSSSSSIYFRIKTIKRMDSPYSALSTRQSWSSMGSIQTKHYTQLQYNKHDTVQYITLCETYIKAQMTINLTEGEQKN